MKLDTKVQHGLLVFTTLAILNSIGIVSSQNELEHGLATDCNSKSMKIESFFQKFSFIDKVCCFLAKICGDKCFDGTNDYPYGKCECGDTTFEYEHVHKYCCIPINETCKVQGM